MKIAITGATGFIGIHLIDQLVLEKGIEFIPLTRESNSKFFSDYSLASLSEWFKKVDVVVHLAAKRGGNGSFFDYQQNISLSEKVAQACKQNSVEKLIYISSISVYSDQNKLPWSEEQKNEPKNYYGLSKLVSEDICRLSLKNSPTNLIVLRLAHVYGPNEKNNYMINLFMRKAFNKEPIDVNNVSDNKREFIYVKDVARAIVVACKSTISKKCMILNVGTDDVFNNQEVAMIITSCFNGGKLNIDSFYKGISKDDSYMKHKKIEEVYKFKPKYTMTQAMNDIYSTMKRDGKVVPIFY